MNAPKRSTVQWIYFGNSALAASWSGGDESQLEVIEKRMENV